MNYTARFAMVVGSAVFSMPICAADSCNGLHITGVIKDQSATVTLKDKTAITGIVPGEVDSIKSAT